MMLWLSGSYCGGATAQANNAHYSFAYAIQVILTLKLEFSVLNKAKHFRMKLTTRITRGVRRETELQLKDLTNIPMDTPAPKVFQTS